MPPRACCGARSTQRSPPSLVPTAALQWLERLELLDRARKPVKALSMGNQQKVQFISAVLHKPRVAVLDEPFSGLDPLNQDLFLTLLRELANDGTTVLLSAHQLQLVERVADELVVINRGQIILQGTVEEVRRGGGRTDAAMQADAAALSNRSRRSSAWCSPSSSSAPR